MTALNTLLDAARLAKGIASDNALGEALGISGQAVNNWRHGRTAIASKHLDALVEMAGPSSAEIALRVIAEQAAGRKARAAWESLLDRLKAAAIAGVVAVALLPQMAHAATPEQSQVIGIMRSVGRWLRKAFAAFTRRFEHGPAHPAPAVLA